MEWSVIIGMVGVVVAILGYDRLRKKDCKDDGKDSGAVKADTEYIKRRVDDVLLEQKETNRSVASLSERVTRAEESIKSAWKRIEHIEGRGDKHDV